MRRLATLCLALAWLVAPGSSASAEALEAEAAAPFTEDPEALSDAELDRRLAFLERSLGQGGTYARVWQYGFTGMYGAGIPWGTWKAATTHTESTRISNIITASKGAIGVGRLLWEPHPARDGADVMLEVPGDDREARIERLIAGEQQLERVAARAEKRLRWERHAGNVLLNAAGGAILIGFGHNRAAIESAGIGIAVGEAMIFTSPWRGVEDRDAYLRRFGGKRADDVEVTLVPTVGGAALVVRY